MYTKKTISPLLGCAVLVFFAGKSHAVAWQKEQNYGIEFGHSDNYTLHREPADAVNGTRKIQEVSTLKAKAGLALVQLKPAYTARIEGKLVATSYSGDTKGYKTSGGGYEGAQLEDRVDGVFSLGLESRRERMSWRFDASLSTDSLLQDISLDTEVDNESDNDDGSVREDVTRTRLTLRPSYSYQLSPVSYMRGSLSVGTAQHDNTPNTFLTDYDEQKINGFYSREFSSVNSWNIDGELRNYEAEGAGQFDGASIGAGILHKFSEVTTLGLRVMQSTTSFEYGDRKGTNSEPLIQLTGEKNTGRTTYSLRTGMRLSGSATGDVVRASELLLNIVYQYSELVTLSWRSKLFENRSLRAFVDADDSSLSEEEKADARRWNKGIKDSNRRYLALEPAVNWHFKRGWVMDAGLRYQREKTDLEEPGESNYAFVGVTFSKKPVGLQK